MSIIYEIISDSRVIIDNNEVFNDQVKQQWELTFERRLGTYDFYLTIEIKQFPKGNSSEMKPMYNLLDIVIKPSAKIRLTIDGDGEFKGLNNQSEILASWVNCKKDILDKFGEDNNILKMVENLEYSFENYVVEISTSVYYFILLSQWKRKKKLTLKTRSTVHDGDSVNIEVVCKDKTKDKDNQTHWIHKGEGEIRHYSRFKKLYEQQLKQYAHAPFDYKYCMSTEYIWGEKKTVFNLFQKSVTYIEEQASDGYKYCNTIQFKLIDNE
ncbi:MAG: hypothetical protein RL662_1067 [Bacteroidota bacterium]|jgi:hypothetical protein